MDQDRVSSTIRLVDGVGFRKLLKEAGKASITRGQIAVAKSMAQQLDTKAIDRDERIIDFIISTATVDREGDTIDVAGWKLDHYLKNPVVLFAHDHYQLPVAQALTVYQEGTKLKSRAKFTSRDEYPFGYMVFQLYAGGYMRATSVGFIPEEWAYADDEAQRSGKGLNFTTQEMIEYSCVPVPANPEALVEARAKGIDTRPYRDWTARVLDERRAHEVGGSQTLIERLHELSDPTGRRIFTSLQEIKLPAEDPKPAADAEDVLQLDDEQPAPADATPADDAPADVPTAEPDPPPVPAEVDKALAAKLVPLEAEAPADTIRWNRSWGKAFDIDRQQFRPGTTILNLAHRFIDCDVKHLARYSEMALGADVGARLTAIDELLGEATIHDTRNIQGESEWPLAYEVIQLNSRRRSEFMVDGIRFMEWRGEKMVFRVEPDWSGIHLSVYAQRGKGSEQARALLEEAATLAASYKFLNGEAFSISGEFLERGNIGIEDVFLESRNEKAIRRAMDLLNTKGDQMEPRGMMLLGPPGTGKTLSGRVMRDQVKGTFIHVAARDLARMGAFYGLLRALKQARELAPAHVFIEDVDNFLDDWTVDMLKTELDGLTQHKGVLVTLTTNYPERMPKALIDRPGRFHDVCSFGLPDDATRLRMVRRWMPGLNPVQQELAVRETAGYSGAHVRELARFADILAEQDELDAGKALELAIAKMREQSELITASRTHGSRYRAPEACTHRQGVATGGVVKSTGVLGTQQLHGTEQVLDEARQKALGEALGGAAQEFRIEVTRVGDVTRAVATMPVEKAGRVLSAKNETALKECADALSGVAERINGVLAQVAQPPAADDSGGEAQADGAAAKAMDVIEAEHVLLLEDEEEVGEVDPDMVVAAVREVTREQVMLLTGRVY
jgi:uncharacterized protein